MSQYLQVLRLTRASDQIQQVRRQSIFSDFQKKLKEEIERYVFCMRCLLTCTDKSRLGFSWHEHGQCVHVHRSNPALKQSVDELKQTTESLKER